MRCDPMNLETRSLEPGARNAPGTLNKELELERERTSEVGK